MRELSPGRWELRVYLGRDPATGKARQQSKVFHGRRRAAETALAEMVTAARARQEPAGLTFGELLDEWLDHAARSKSPTTMVEYRRIVARRLQPALGKVTLGKLTARHFDRLYGRLGDDGLSPASIRRVHAVARRALAQAVRWQYLTSNAAAAAEPPPVPRYEADVPTVADLARLVDHAAQVDEDLAVLFVVAAGLGARRGELCGLQWRDVDLETGRVRVHRNVVEPSGRIVVKDTKSHQERTMKLPAAALAALTAHRARMDERARLFECALRKAAFVFSEDPDGERPLRPAKVTRAFTAARRAAGLGDGVRLHDLRHLNASLQIAAGVDPATVARRLGHAQVSTTLNIYTTALPEGDDVAVAALDRLLG